MNPIPNGYVTPPANQLPATPGAIQHHHQPPAPEAILLALQALHNQHPQPVAQVLFPENPYVTPPGTPPRLNAQLNAPLKPAAPVDPDLQNRAASAARCLFQS